ncbi:MAG: cyclic nucleotide-binding domain-containing protein [Acidimicrobiales bacterium]
MRFESSVVSLSWIPSEAVAGLTALPFNTGVAHYDGPPPDVLTDLDGLRQADAFRFANELRAWIEVDGGRIVGWGQEGGGHIGATTLRVGSRNLTFAAVALPDLRPDPEVSDTSVRFVQTAGGRTGLPAPRRVSRPPFVQLTAPLAWTTLALTMLSDGSSTFEVLGASAFPRHWVYDRSGALAVKSGVIDFDHWYREAFGAHSPWGDEHSPAVVTAVETELERRLSRVVMGGGRKREIRNLETGQTLVNQGAPGDELFLLLDGVLHVEVDGDVVAEIGPGAILGERAILEGGRRTSTLRAVTKCRVAVAAAGSIDLSALGEVSGGHRREERPA